MEAGPYPSKLKDLREGESRPMFSSPLQPSSMSICKLLALDRLVGRISMPELPDKSSISMLLFSINDSSTSFDVSQEHGGLIIRSL
jgi:hypothetical protein